MSGEGWGREANYRCCTLVPRMPIEVETDWLISKGSLLQKQCLLWSQAPPACCGHSCGQAVPSVSPHLPALAPACSPQPRPHSCLNAFSPVPSITSMADQHLSSLVSFVLGGSCFHSCSLYTDFWSIISSN